MGKGRRRAVVTSDGEDKDVDEDEDMDTLLFGLELLLYMEEEHQRNLAESESRHDDSDHDDSDPVHPPYLAIEEQYEQELVAYYQMVYYQMLDGMGPAMTWDYDDMGAATHPAPPPVVYTPVKFFVARTLVRNGGGDHLGLRAAPSIISQGEEFAAISTILDKSSINSAGAIVLLPVESGEGITLCITAKLEGIADAGFSGGCVHVDNIVSTTSSASEVRVVGCIMLHCRDKAAEQQLQAMLGERRVSLDSWLVVVSSPSPGSLGLSLQVHLITQTIMNQACVHPNEHVYTLRCTPLRCTHPYGVHTLSSPSPGSLGLSLQVHLITQTIMNQACVHPN